MQNHREAPIVGHRYRHRRTGEVVRVAEVRTGDRLVWLVGRESPHTFYFFNASYRREAE